MLVITDKYNLLIDCGLSMKKINDLLLMSEGLSLEDINFILITHAHSDHILGLLPIYNKYENIRFVTTKQIQENIQEKIQVKKPSFKFDSKRFVNVDSPKHGKTLSIISFPLKHDTACVGYSISDSSESLCFISDNGQYPLTIMDNPIFEIPYTYYAVESNYDINLQYQDKKRDTRLKRRVLSTKGHSDNYNAIEKAIKLLQVSDNNICKGIMFHHLSEDCNSKEIAMESHNNYIETWGHKRLLSNIKISYAEQNSVVKL